MHKENTIPKLAPAGAGVPLPQKLMMRFLIGPFIAGKTTTEDSEKKLFAITEKIIAQTKNLSAEQLHTKILVPEKAYANG